jgi:hypothetical protein
MVWQKYINKLSLHKITLIFLFLALTSTMLWNNSAALESDKISIEVSEVPLKEVFRKITSDTGYEIKINEKLAEIPLTIKLENITLESGLKRIMNSLQLENNAIITDEKKKIIEILTFYPDPAQLSENIKKSGNEELGITIAVKEVLTNHQLAEIPDNYIETPPSESDEPGMTIKGLEELHKRQLAEISNNFDDTLPPSELEEPDSKIK